MRGDACVWADLYCLASDVVIKHWHVMLALDCNGADHVNYLEKGNALLPDFGRGVVS